MTEYELEFLGGNRDEIEEYISGLVDAEGSMSAGVSKEENRNIGYKVTPQISFTQFSPSYIGGIFDGDGCVRLSVSQNDEYRSGYFMSAQTELVQTGNNALECILVIASVCDDVGIEFNICEHETTKQNGYSFNVYHTRSAKKFLDMIKPHLIIKREQAEIMTEEIIPRIENKEHLEKKGFLEIIAWRDEMNSYKGGNRGKYNLEYFENEWGMELKEGKKP